MIPCSKCDRLATTTVTDAQTGYLVLQQPPTCREHRCIMTDHDIIRWESEGGAIGASSRGNDVAESAEIRSLSEAGRWYGQLLVDLNRANMAGLIDQSL